MTIADLAPNDATAAPADRVTFDTADLAPGEAFDRYRELYSVGAEAMRFGDDVAASVALWRLDGMLLYERRLDNIGHRRSAARIDADGFDHFTATLLIGGEMIVEADTGLDFQLVEPGAVLLIDTQVPASNRMSRAHLVTLSIARARIAALAPDVDQLHGITLSAAEARLYREFVVSLLASLPTMTQATIAKASNALASLLSIAIANHDANRRRDEPSPDGDRMRQLKRLIDRRIGDPRFDANDVVSEFGLSRATLYRLVAPEGGLATLIRHRRLERVRRALGDPGDTRPFAAIAADAGLKGAAQAARAFAARYALVPAEYRDLATSGSVADAVIGMRLWQDEVRRGGRIISPAVPPPA